MATTRYFDTMGIPIVAGRAFTDQDIAGGDRVVIVDERMATTLWPGESPLGKRLRYGDDTSATTWEMESLALPATSSNTRSMPTAGSRSIGRTGQQPARSLYVVMRATGDAAALGPGVHAAIRSIDPDLPVFRIKNDGRAGR